MKELVTSCILVVTNSAHEETEARELSGLDPLTNLSSFKSPR